MTSPSFRDITLLSAYLDGQISHSSRSRLESRLRSEPVLARALEELRQTQSLLRRVPYRRAPRRFTLKPGMPGLRAPTPRLVPALSWASAVAMLLFVCTVSANLLGGLPLGASAPMMAAAPSGYGGGPPPEATLAPAMAAPATEAPVAMAAPATMAPVQAEPTTQAPAFDASTSMANPTATPMAKASATESLAGQNMEATIAAETAPNAVTGAVPQPQAPMVRARKPVNKWLIVWPGLAGLLGMLALLVHWLNQRNFRRKHPSK